MARPAVSPYRILSIDGGGLKGIIALAILQRLDAAVPAWREGVNMFAGTSTGALIALGLARRMTPAELLDVYVSKGPLVFDRSLWHEIKDLNNIVGPKYDSINRESLCKDVLGENTRLGELLSANGQAGHVVITAFDLDNQSQQDPARRRWKAKIFHNLPTRDGSGDDDEYAYRVAMRTSAAPTFFASYDGFVDGGVFANNPSMCALAQTQDPRLARGIPFGRVRLLSIGTGFYAFHLGGEESWGIAQWAPTLVDLLMDGVNEVADFQVRQMLPDGNYCRIAPPLQTNIAMDDPSMIGVLRRLGDAVSIADARQFVTRW